MSPYLWACQQAIEKYLKCILLPNRISAPKVFHDLDKALAIAESDLRLDLTPRSQEFIRYINEYGGYRYLEISSFASGRSIIELDRTVWELRRFCTLDRGPREMTLRSGVVPPKVRLKGGYLEEIIDDKNHPARPPLVRGNGFFGPRSRKRVSVGSWTKLVNAPLSLHPEILDEVRKYIFLPKHVIDGYRVVTHT